MGLHVRFFGLCLYVLDRSPAVVLLPRAVAPPPKHRDKKDVGNAHYRNIFFPDKSRVRDMPASWDGVVDLNRKHVWFDFQSGAPPFSTALNRPIRLQDFATDIRLDEDPDNPRNSFTSCKLDLAHGVLSTKLWPLHGPWYILDTLGRYATYDQVPEEFNWDVDNSQSATMHVGPLQGAGPVTDYQIDLSAGEVEVWVGNVDEIDPAHMPGPRYDCNGVFPCYDHDFKWFYRLLEAKQGTIEGRLAGRELPVPTIDAPPTPLKAPKDAPLVSVSTPTCLGLVYP